MNFKESETCKNIMKAFAGESQARNRYTFAASIARKNNLYVVEAVFNYTAGQEKEHGEIFYNMLQDCAGETIFIDGGYPVDLSNNVEDLLKMAQHNELEEYSDVYDNFAKVAKDEGFDNIANTFSMIAEIEKVHSDRFGRLAEELQSGRMFMSDCDTKWMCLNCGHVLEAKGVPEACPVCKHDKGYFIRMEFSPYEN
ncbi:MAG: rubrerythrin family protein [Monoglobales bacterium]